MLGTAAVLKAQDDKYLGKVLTSDTQSLNVRKSFTFSKSNGLNKFAISPNTNLDSKTTDAGNKEKNQEGKSAGRGSLSIATSPVNRESLLKRPTVISQSYSLLKFQKK